MTLTAAGIRLTFDAEPNVDELADALGARNLAMVR